MCVILIKAAGSIHSVQFQLLCPLCPPTPKNRTACKTQPPCQLITALLLQSSMPHRWPTSAACPAQLEIYPEVSGLASLSQSNLPSCQVDQREASGSPLCRENEITPPQQGACLWRTFIPGNKIIVEHHLHQLGGHYNKSDALINSLNA